MYPGVSIITLGVANVGEASRFYQRLGWRLSAGASNESISFFSLNNIVLALFGADALAADSGLAAGDDQKSISAPAFSGMALAQNYPSEAAVRHAMDHAISAGARALVKPEATFWGGYHGVFADPDGHIWELAHNPFFRLAPDGTLDLPE